MSAEIEKFYSLSQFLAVMVMFLCQAALAAGMARLIAYARPGRHRTRCVTLLGFLLLWFVQELLLSLAPSADHLRLFLYAEPVAPLMPALVLAVWTMEKPSARGGKTLPAVLIALFAALTAAVAIVDRHTGLFLERGGLPGLPVARPFFWILPAAAFGIAAFSSIISLIRGDRRPLLNIGVLLAYAAWLACRLFPEVTFNPFIFLFLVSAASVFIGVEDPLRRMLPVHGARDLMRSLPEGILVYDHRLALAGHNGGPLTGVLAGYGTLGEAIAGLRSLCARWTLDLEETRFADPAQADAYDEGEISIGARDFSVTIGPARGPAGIRGCVLVLQEITEHRSAVRRAESAYGDLRSVRARLERYAAEAFPRDVEQDKRERMQALRTRTRERLLAAALAVESLEREAGSGPLSRDRIASAAADLRACLSDIRGTVSQLRRGS